jgi:uncharacterized protein
MAVGRQGAMTKRRSRGDPHAFQFNVAQLLKQPSGTRRVYDIDTADGPPLDDDLKVVAPFRGEVRFMRVGAGILVTGELETRVELDCSRCLTAFQTTTRFEIEEEFRPTHDVNSGARLAQEPDQDAATLIDERHILDLAEVIRQDLTLSLPSSPLCRPDCKGLCPNCGQDWNEGSCDCDTQVIDPRWEALKASFED